MAIKKQVKALRDALDAISDMHNRPPKIIWHSLPGRKLKATWEVQSRGYEYGLKESDMDPIHQWCQESLPGAKRLSFDTFVFATDEQLTAFLLRWA